MKLANTKELTEEVITYVAEKRDLELSDEDITALAKAVNLAVN